MRAVYMQEPHNVSMIEMANPQPGAGDVLIRIHRVGPVSYTHLTLPTTERV